MKWDRELAHKAIEGCLEDYDIQFHTTYNGAETPRYIVIDIDQNKKRFQKNWVFKDYKDKHK